MAGRFRKIGMATVVSCMVLVASAQQPLFDVPNRSVVKQAAVEYLYPEQVNVPANKSTAVELHFRIAQGLHINSHNPHDETLIPTVFTISDGAGVRLEAANYPAGVDVVLPSAPKTKLNVYTGEFIVKTKITAALGNHLVEGKLRYQACDQQACMPPRTIPVVIDVIAK